VISWPSPSTGFTLQTNSNVANVAGWSNFGGTVNDNGVIEKCHHQQPANRQFVLPID
jgi:hypothetical protein